MINYRIYIGILCISSILPIFEFIFAIYYENKITCNGEISLTVNYWLIIKGIFTLFFIILTLFTIMCRNRNQCYAIYQSIFSLFHMTILIWYIIGSVLFWRDCADVKPVIVYNYLWFSIIFGYTSLIATILLYRKHTRDMRQQALLDIYTAL